MCVGIGGGGGGGGGGEESSVFLLCHNNTHLGAQIDVFCQRAVCEGVLEMVGVDAGAMGDH